MSGWDGDDHQRRIEAQLEGTDPHGEVAFVLRYAPSSVPLFTPPGTTAAVVAGCARHVVAGGVLVAGFQLGRGYELVTYDAEAAAADLELAARSATWNLDPFTDDADHAVSVHRPAHRPDHR